MSTTGVARSSITQERDRTAFRKLPTRPTPWRDLLCYVAMLCVSLAPSWPLYRHPSMFVAAAAALVAGLACAAFVLPRAWPWAAKALAVLGVGALVGIPAAVPTEATLGFLPSVPGASTFVAGLALAWGDILSVDPPLGAYQAVLVPLYLVVFFGALAAWWGFSKGRRLPGLLSVAALLLFGIVFGARVGYLPIWVGFALVVIGVFWVVIIRPIATGLDPKETARLRRGNVRRGVIAVAFALVCAVLGAAVAQALPGQDRDVLRAAFEPPYSPEQGQSPLQAYRSYVSGEQAQRSVATVTGVPAGTMLRTAVLDSYDGVAFVVGPDAGEGGASGSFTRVPYQVDRPDDAESLTAHVHTEQALGQWLPHVTDLLSAKLPPASGTWYYNKTLDAVAVKGGVGTGWDYTVTGLRAPQPLTGDLSALSPGTAKQGDIPAMPEKLVEAGGKAWANAETDGERLEAALRYLRAGYVSHSGKDEVFSRSGHSVERLNLLASDDPMVGDAEQYATAFALLAREIGFPSRVVMGFVTKSDGGAVTGGDLTAWVEVEDAARGWVAIDPNPPAREVPRKEKQSENAISPPRTILAPDAPKQEQPIAPQADESTRPEDEPEPAWKAIVAAIWWWAWRVGLVLAVLTSPLWLVLLGEAIRRRWRRWRDRKSLSVRGGWAEVRDEVIDASVPIAAADTRNEVAKASGNQAVATLARTADRLTFSGEPIGRKDVDAFWRGTRPARKTLLEQLRRGPRFRAKYSWISLSRATRDAWLSAWRRRKG